MRVYVLVNDGAGGFLIDMFRARSDDEGNGPGSLELSPIGGGE